MKEHFNAINRTADNRPDMNPLSTNVKKTSAQRTVSSDNSTDSVAKPVQEDEAFLLNPEEWYHKQMDRIDRLGNSGIVSLEPAAALESSMFVRNLAQSEEGRNQMSMAHNPINSQNVLQLFDIR